MVIARLWRRLAALLMLSPRELGALAVVFALSLPAVTARLYSSDEVEYFSYLRSVWFDRDVSFENEYQYFYDHHIAQTPDFHATFLELQTATGRRINYGTIGCAILWSPFYAVGDAVAHAMRAAGHDVTTDGYSRPYVSAVAYGSAFYGFATILLGIRAARRVLGSGALTTGLAIWAGTPLLFYMYVAPPFSHACSAFAVALLVTVWLHVRREWTWRGGAALGLAAALVAMVREQDALFAVGPAVDFALGFFSKEANRSRAGLAMTALAGAAAFAIGYLPQLLAYQALNGFPKPSPLVTRKMSWHAPHALQVLGSPEHGFFFWTPLAVIALAGVVMMAARGVPSTSGDWPIDSGSADRRRIGACMLLMVACQVYVSGAVESWTVAGAFGQRRFVAVTVLLVVGLEAARSALRTRAARAILGAAMAVCVWWNVALMAEFATRMMDRQRLEPARNAYDAFVTLPRMAPELVYRYFTERASFYKPPAEPPAPPR